MTFLKQNILKFSENKILVFLYFIFINLPVLIFTFDTTNWSDDYQYVNLLAVKAKFSPILPLLSDITGGHSEGGHFAPIYNLINYLITLISLNPQFFHLIVVLCYIATAFFIFLLVERYYNDKTLGILAGTIFAINYYIGFKGLTWNVFHFPVTNTLTGIISLYFFVRYLQQKQRKSLLICTLFFLLTIFNYESGFVFFPVLIIIAFFSWLKKEIRFKKLVLVVLILSVMMALFPVGAYLKTGKPFPLSHRFKWKQSLQGYAFNANELFIKSLGFSILYNKLIFNNLKDKDPQLKEAVIDLVLARKKLNLRNLPVKFILGLLALAVFTVLLFIFIMVLILTRIRKQTYLFLVVYGAVFLIHIFVFCRADIANSISIFSSIIVADLIISCLRDNKKSYRKVGIGILGFYFVLTSWTILDKFDDCYSRSFLGPSKNEIQRPDRLYRAINEKIGGFAENGIIIFIPFYAYSPTSSPKENSEEIDVGIFDLACFNATLYYRELLKTDIVNEYKDKSLIAFTGRFSGRRGYKKIIVQSEDEALEYLRTNNINTSKVEAIYVSKNSDIIKLNKD